MYLVFGTWGKQFRIHHRDLHLLPVEANEFIQEEEEGRWDQVDVKAWLLEEGKAAMDHCLPETQHDRAFHYLTALPRTASISSYWKLIISSGLYSHQGIDKDVKIMRDPKPSETDTSEIVRGKDIHKGQDKEKNDPCHACK